MIADSRVCAGWDSKRNRELNSGRTTTLSNAMPPINATGIANTGQTSRSTRRPVAPKPTRTLNKTRGESHDQAWVFQSFP